MTSPAIRLSPSGPKIGNDSGGTLRFGDGARLRRVLKTSALTTGFLDATPLVLLDVALPDPAPGLKYAARLDLDLKNTAGAGVAIADIQTSADGGATWITRAQGEVPVGGQADGQMGQHVSLEFPDLNLTGAAAGVTGSTAALQARARIAVPSGAQIQVYSIGTNGTLSLSLEEIF